MPTVAELDVQINAKDDASATILALDALLKDLDGDDVDIDVSANTAEVQAKIRELLLRLQQLDTTDPDIDIDVDAAGAMAEIAILRAELDGINDESVRIRMDSQDVRRSRSDFNEFRNSAIQASRSVSGVAAAVLGLGAALVPIGAVAIGGIGALSGALATAGIGAALFGAVAIRSFSPVKTALTQLKAATDEYNKATTDKERDAALAKTKAIMDGLDPSVRTMVTSIQDFRKAWGDFALQFQPQIFQIAQEGLAGLASLLPSLAPIVNGAAGAFLSLERSAIRALQGPFWQEFISMIGDNVGPIMNQLGRTIGNLLVGLGGLITAFMPLTRDFTKGLEGMSKSFADWATNLKDSKGFQDFVDYIRENTPLVLGLLASMGGAFVALVKAAAPLGEALVVMATHLFDAITAFEQAHPRAMTLALGLLALLAVATKLLGPILTIGRLVGVLASAFLSLIDTVGLMAAALGIGTGAMLGIIAVIALLVAGIIYAYTHFETFRNIVNSVAKAIADFAVAAYNAIVAGLGAAASWLSSTFGPAIGAVVAFVVEQFNHIRDWWSQNSGTFQAAWNNLVTFFTTLMQIIGTVIGAGLALISALWSAVWPTLEAVIMGVWTAIKGIISGALDIILGILLVFGGIFAGDWGAIWDGIVQVATGVWEIIKGVFSGAFQVLQALARAFGDVLLAILGAVWSGIAAGLSAAWATIVGLFQAVWGVMVTVVQTGVNAIQNVINAFWAAVQAVFVAGWNLLVAGLSAAWATIVAITTTTWNAVKAVTTAAWSAIQTAITVAWNFILSIIRTDLALIQTAITVAWNAIRTAISTAMSMIQSVISTAWNVIRTVVSTAMSNIQSVISTAWSVIRSLVSSAMSTIKSVVQTGWDAIRSAVSTAMSNIKSAISTGMSAAKSAVSSGIDSMVSAVTGAAGRFLSAGRSLMSNLASGIVSGIGNAVGAVRNAVGQITSLLPGSPAKTGPLSGQGYTMIRGQHFSEDLAAGISGRAGLVARAAGDIADLMTLNLDSGAAFNAMASGATASAGVSAGGYSITVAPGAIVLQVGDGVSAGEARQAFDGAAGSLADELLTAMRRR